MTSNPMAGWSTLMSRLGTIFTAPALEWRVDPINWPAIADRRDGQPIGALILVIGVIWLAVALRNPIAGGAGIAGLGASGGWLSCGIGVALALWGCRVLMRRQTIRIDQAAVHVQVRGMLGVTSWSEPLANYGGVVWRSEPIRRRDDWQIVHLIDLWHEDPGKIVTLFSSTSDCAVQDLWRAWALRLGLAPIRWRAAGATLAPGPSDAGLASSHGAHSS